MSNSTNSKYGILEKFVCSILVGILAIFIIWLAVFGYFKLTTFHPQKASPVQMASFLKSLDKSVHACSATVADVARELHTDVTSLTIPQRLLLIENANAAQDYCGGFSSSATAILNVSSADGYVGVVTLPSYVYGWSTGDLPSLLTDVATYANKPGALAVEASLVAETSLANYDATTVNTWAAREIHLYKIKNFTWSPLPLVPITNKTFQMN
jgi:hypothetical protein